MITWTPIPDNLVSKVSQIWQRKELTCLTELLVEEMGFQVMLVGGAVRDILLEHPVKDFDILVTCSPQVLAELRPRLAGRSGVTVIPLDSERGYFRVCYQDSEGVDVAALDRPSVWHDLRRRDITFNAMALDPQGRLADPFHGRHDLAHRRVRVVHEDVLEDDPLRVLRCLRLAAVLNFDIEPETLAQLQTYAPRLKDVAGERIQIELLRFLHTAGLRQWESLRLSQAVEAVFEVPEEMVPWSLLNRWWSASPSRPRGDLDANALLSAILCQSDTPEKHLQRLRPSNELLRFCQKWWSGYDFLLKTSPTTVREIWQLVELTGESLPGLLEFVGLPEFPRPIPEGLKIRLLEAASGKGELRLELLPLNGHDLCAHLGRKPGPWVGGILTELKAAWACREVDSREGLLDYSVAIFR